MPSLFRTSSAVSPAVLRLTLGFVLFPHATQKALGWFGGGGIAGTLSFFEGLGIPAGVGLLLIGGGGRGAADRLLAKTMS